MFRHIEILSALFCLLLLYHNVNTKLCPAGQRKIYGQDKCEDCPKEQYSTNKGEEIVCLHCSKCKEGSEIDVKCNPTRDTRCRCKPGYTPVDMLKQTFCICEVGYGLEHAGKLCIKCIHGFFSNKQNSDCQKWKECKSGIRIPGNNTSDAVCNPVIATSTPKTITTSYIATDVHKVISTSTPKTITTSYIATDVHTVISTLTPKPQNKDRFYILWLVLVCGVILLLMGLLYHKCITTYCILNNTKLVSRKESACKKPVEESGEKCLSLLV